MWQYNQTGELAHYGIPRMKWGVRRYQNKDGSLTPEGRKRYGYDDDDDVVDSHDDYKKAHKRASVRSMSDQELRNRLNRLQMEKQYAQLTAPEKSAGAKFVKNVLSNAASQTATKYVSKYMDKGVEAVIKKMSDKKN